MNKKLEYLKSLVYLGLINPNEYMIDKINKFYLSDAGDARWMLTAYNNERLNSVIILYDLESGNYYNNVFIKRNSSTNTIFLDMTEYASGVLFNIELNINDALDRFIICHDCDTAWRWHRTRVGSIVHIQSRKYSKMR